jgi:ABC-type Fe3+/spermidine/putrescine transport system ATPase subunit
LALEPELLLLDEPFSALDPTTRSGLWRDFQRIIKETGTTTVFVTHDRDEAFVLADRIAALADGDLLQIGSRHEIFARPASATVAELVGFDNRLRGKVEGQDGDQVEISLGDRKVRAKGESRGSANVLVCIRAENISLGTECVNPMNCVRGKVSDIAAGVTRDRIVLDCGAFRLVAEVDRKNCPAHDLRVGDETAAAFDPASVHVVPVNDTNKCS